MPKYTVKPEADYPTAMPSSEKKKKRYPTVTIPVSKEIIAALKVDGPVVVELKGFVQKLNRARPRAATRTTTAPRSASSCARSRPIRPRRRKKPPMPKSRR
jgi:hypothetical protein